MRGQPIIANELVNYRQIWPDLDRVAVEQVPHPIRLVKLAGKRVAFRIDVNAKLAIVGELGLEGFLEAATSLQSADVFRL